MPGFKISFDNVYSKGHNFWEDGVVIFFFLFVQIVLLVPSFKFKHSRNDRQPSISLSLSTLKTLEIHFQNYAIVLQSIFGNS